MTTIYIAEKPDIASAIAAYLWKDHATLRTKHCYQKGDIIVTWAYGHIMTPAMPEAYGKEYADYSCYPVIPKTWKKHPSPSTKEQFDFIKNALKTADVVIHGGDPDREGQLLVDEILDYVRYKGEVRRILINAKDEDSMRRAFDNIVPNSRFTTLYHAGLARERADWLVGINLSRAYTVNARQGGMGNIWRIGRVKTPTLALVVQREREIKNFCSVDYYELTGRFSKEEEMFSATLVPDEKAPIDSEGRILDKAYLEEILIETERKEAVCTLYEKKSQTESPPLPYSLDTLQVEANKRHGMSPSLVLEKVQSLYEKKYVSYPRSDCNYIPTSQFADAGRIVSSLMQYGLQGSERADISIKGRGFNDSKVNAHHAIIPTGVQPVKLDRWEKLIYEMISFRYVLQFFPPCLFEVVHYNIKCMGHNFSGSGKVVHSMGWREVLSNGEEEEVSSVPLLQVGEVLPSLGCAIKEKKTTPPKRFTEGTLLAAMTNIWRFVSPNNPNREKLKECKGIGTPATRDSIISDLMDGKSGNPGRSPCIEKKGKELFPTEFGTFIIEHIHESLTRPDLTAEMEYSLSAIADGKVAYEEFMQATTDMVLQNIGYANETAGKMKATASNAENPEKLGNCECPVCHRNTLTRKFSTKRKAHFWICDDKSCVHPSTHEPIYYDELRKKPVIRLCPKCQSPLSRLYSSKTKQHYWFCPQCNEFKNIK